MKFVRVRRLAVAFFLALAFVALAAPASRVTSLHGADIQVLPGAAVAAILGGENPETVPDFDAYRAAGVAEEELKIGLVPGKA